MREKQNITEILIIRQVCHHMLFNIGKCLLVPVDFDTSVSQWVHRRRRLHFFFWCTIILQEFSFVMFSYGTLYFLFLLLFLSRVNGRTTIKNFSESIHIHIGSNQRLFMHLKSYRQLFHSRNVRNVINIKNGVRSFVF